MTDKIRSRILEAVIYPDSSKYNCDSVLEKLNYLECEYAYILHDKDTYTDLDCDNSSQIGTLKKPHYHVLMRFDNARTIDSVYPTLGITYNSLEVKNNFKKSVQYLVHLNHKHKFQYSAADIISNFDLDKYFTLSDSESKDIPIIIQAIKDNDICTITELMCYCASHNLYATYRRSQSSFHKVINEHIKEKYAYEQYERKQQIEEIKEDFKACHLFDVVRDDSIDFGM